MIWSSHGAARPRRLIVTAIAALIPLLAGCETGNDPPTSQWHQPTEGASALVGEIVIRNVFILGPAIGQQIPAGQNAGLYFAIVNGGTPDKLISISAPAGAQSVTLPASTISLATNQAVLLTGPAPESVLENLTRPLSGGGSVAVDMTFQKAGCVRLRVPVVPNARYFATFSPAPSPTPTVQPSGKKRKHASTASPSLGASNSTAVPSPGPDPAPTATPSPSAC